MSYFKNTPRKRMTEQEKRETLEAVDRAVSYLNDRYHSFTMPEIESVYDIPGGLRYSRNVMPYLSRIVTLIKGRTQPKNFNKERRKSQIFWESSRIAIETGADFQAVHRLFKIYMDYYLHP